MEGINSLNCSDLIHLTKLIPIKNKFHHKQQISYTYPPKNNFSNGKLILARLKEQITWLTHLACLKTKFLHLAKKLIIHTHLEKAIFHLKKRFLYLPPKITNFPNEFLYLPKTISNTYSKKNKFYQQE